jgi:hypothetical protein
MLNLSDQLLHSLLGLYVYSIEAMSTCPPPRSHIHLPAAAYISKNLYHQLNARIRVFATKTTDRNREDRFGAGNLRG